MANADEFTTRVLELKRFQEALKNKQQTTPVQPQITATEVHDRIAEQYQEKLAKAAKLSFTPTLTDKYATISGAVREYKGEVTDWKDLSLGDKEHFPVSHWNFDEPDIDAHIQYAEDTFKKLFTRLTAGTVCRLLQVAYNLRDPSNHFAFAPRDERLGSTMNQIDPDDLEDVVLYETSDDPPVFIEITAHTLADKRKILTGFSFLACSWIRLTTKSARNFERISSHLHKSFSRLYGYDLPIVEYKPPYDLVEKFKNCLTMHNAILHTIYIMVYAGEVETAGDNIKELLYRLHIRYTGLHALSLFHKVALVYNITPRLLAQSLDNPCFETQLETIASLYASCYKTDDDHRCQMWQFARIFSEKFAPALQTKNCAKFVYILAKLLHDEEVKDEKNSGDVFKITHLQNMPEKGKESGDHMAERARTLIQYFSTSGNYRELLMT
uniref:Nucleoprotein n=1 Tax=Spinach virus 1_Tur TaxID=2977991 RepID=A0A9N6YJJ8_9RHAB|nr:TPA_asm: nucleocapsid protein [Spinach virus 1_Tur]